MGVTNAFFGNLKSGEEIRIYHIENASGAYAEVIPYGAILVKLCVPDRKAVLRDVVLGYDDLAEYEVNGCFFGATIGPNGNRIEGGRFTVGGQEYVISQNENENNLHSGPDGFEKKIWDVETGEDFVKFSRISPDGENGFPGEMKVSVTYTLTADNELRITYDGVSNRDTIANLTNHSYFNLAGEGSGKVLDQKLLIRAKEYTPVKDSHAIPVGENAPVAGTPMDFTEAKPIGQEIEADFEQLHFTGGYDHNFVTDDYEAGCVRSIACAFCETSGIVMEVFSDQPCVQFYAGNFVNGEKGKNGHIYEKRDGFCLETQVEPNAVNVPAFHSPVVRAGEPFHTVTGYKFSVR